MIPEVLEAGNAVGGGTHFVQIVDVFDSVIVDSVTV